MSRDIEHLSNNNTADEKWSWDLSSLSPEPLFFTRTERDFPCSAWQEAFVFRKDKYLVLSL